MSDKLVGPLDKIFHVGGIGMAAVMLAPGELPFQQACVDGGHFFGMIVVGYAQVFCPQELEDRTCGNGCHIAALVVEPSGVTLFRYAIAYKGQPGSAESNQFMRVDGKVLSGSGAEGSFG